MWIFKNHSSLQLSPQQWELRRPQSEAQHVFEPSLQTPLSIVSSIHHLFIQDGTPQVQVVVRIITTPTSYS